jgi:uncharacterized protein YbbC (DUF1343 family)
MDTNRLGRIDEAVKQAIEQKRLPGAVVLVVRQGKAVFRKAYGQRSKQPDEQPMTVETVFDLASLTKPLATALSVMILVEQGKLRLQDPVARHLPDFSKNGKEGITIEQLLLHTSGLLADNPVDDYRDGPVRARERIHALRCLHEPGSRFLYSDVNYILLGELVEKVGGVPLEVFFRKNIAEPLGLHETGFRPGKELAKRAAPTEQVDENWLQGEVHDPRARLLGGVAGHAGLFSTADDLAVCATMILNEGSYHGRRILSPASVREMTRPRSVPGGQRALGWDVQTAFSHNRGEHFAGFGHTGFTGTSLWIDPPSQTVVIFLSNRVHPDGKGNVNRLRNRVATLVADSIVAPPYPGGRSSAGAGAIHPVQIGLDLLVRDGFRSLRGRRVGLVTNHTGLDREGKSAIDLLHKAEGVRLVALFGPEHGIRGAADELVPDGKEEKTGLPVYSLYGKNRRPTAEQLKGIDTLVYDIQDIGCRFYTYETTLGYLLETAAAHRLRVVVLDRPNPIGGIAVEGPLLDRKRESFTGYHPLPVRHGLTVGELARLFNEERRIGADLEVVKLEGWRRADLFDRTGLTWVNPSPNMRTLAGALLYPGIGLLETTNVSVGRGTDRPFEFVGAPWIDGRRLAAELARQSPPGVRFVPVRFCPTSSTHAGKECGGVQLFLDDWQRFESLPTGLALACALQRLYPEQWQGRRYLALLANEAALEALLRGDSPAAIKRGWQEDLERFLKVRKRYLLY